MIELFVIIGAIDMYIFSLNNQEWQLFIYYSITSMRVSMLYILIQQNIVIQNTMKHKKNNISLTQSESNENLKSMHD